MDHIRKWLRKTSKVKLFIKILGEHFCLKKPPSVLPAPFVLSSSHCERHLLVVDKMIG